MPLDYRRLLRVGKAKKVDLTAWKEGASLSNDFGVPIESLQLWVASDRWKLALEHRRDGARLFRCKPCPYRSVVSRYYYCMYHVLRTVAYVSYGGDDHESHSDLPTKIPKDFPDSEHWKNVLKDARTDRNASDYDPYPRKRVFWQQKAERMHEEVRKLVLHAKPYLVAKGVEIK